MIKVKQIIKYLGLLSLLILIKILVIIISFLLIWLWGCLIKIGTVWSVLLAFFPVVIINFILMGYYIYKNWNGEEWCSLNFNNDEHTEVIYYLFLLSIVPPILICIVMLAIVLAFFNFPNKYAYADLEIKSIFEVFISLINI